jgi:hypothetical protein
MRSKVLFLMLLKYKSLQFKLKIYILFVFALHSLN